MLSTRQPIKYLIITVEDFIITVTYQVKFIIIVIARVRTCSWYTHSTLELFEEGKSDCRGTIASG